MMAIIFTVFTFSLIFLIDYMDVYGVTQDLIYSWLYLQCAINLIFLLELLIMFYAYGVMYLLKVRSYAKIEMIIQIINSILIFDFLIYGHADIELKLLEVTLLGRY